MNTRTQALPGFINDVLNLGFDKIFTDEAAPSAWGQVPVNITETPDAFELSVVAPGREKADFQIKLDQNVLTISYEKKENEPKEGNKNIRQEYTLKSFKRSFTISDKVDATKTAAQYINGVLHVVLPKKEDVKVSPVQIEIA
jgi:HSP20 family protein